MRGKHFPKVTRPFTRSRTQQDEQEPPLMNFQVLFPEERNDIAQLNNIPKVSKQVLTQKNQRKRPTQPSSAHKAVELPKIEHYCSGSQTKTDTPEPKTPLVNIIPDNEFLDMKELIENPEYAIPETPIRMPERTGCLGEKAGALRQWMRSEEKQYRRRSPPPIILESPLINRSNRFLKVCRSKAFSLQHRGSVDPLEMTFHPSKNGGRTAL